MNEWPNESGGYGIWCLAGDPIDQNKKRNHDVSSHTELYIPSSQSTVKSKVRTHFCCYQYFHHHVYCYFHYFYGDLQGRGTNLMGVEYEWSWSCWLCRFDVPSIDSSLYTRCGKCERRMFWFWCRLFNHDSPSHVFSLSYESFFLHFQNVVVYRPDANHLR